MNTKIEEDQTNLTPNSQPELITQDTPQPSSRVEELNNLIDRMDIEKNPNKRKAPTPSNEKRTRIRKLKKPQTISSANPQQKQELTLESRY